MSCRVALVNFQPWDIHGASRSLALGYLKAYAASRLGAMADIRLFDYRLDRSGRPSKEALTDLISFSPDVVGLTCLHWNILGVIRFSRALKRTAPGVRIILGGTEASGRGAPLLAESGADAIVFGEGEATLEEMLRRFLAGRPWAGTDGTWVREGDAVVEGRPRAFIADLDDIPSPILSGDCALASSGYAMVVLETSRGCPKNCKFCVWTYKSKRVRPFSSGRVRAEIEWLVENTARNGNTKVTVVFADADIFLNKRRGIEIARAIRRVSTPNILWIFQSDLRHWTEELAREVDYPGFKFCFGIDSLNNAALREANRGAVNAGLLDGKIRMLRKLAPRAGFILQFMIGMPGDTLQSLMRGIDWAALRSDCDFFRTQVFPGSHYYRDAAKLGIEYEGAPYYYVRACESFPADDIRRANRLAFDVCILLSDPTLAQGLRALAVDRYGGSVTEAVEKALGKTSPRVQGLLDSIWRQYEKGIYYAGMAVNFIDASSRIILVEEVVSAISALRGRAAGGGSPRGRRGPR